MGPRMVIFLALWALPLGITHSVLPAASFVIFYIAGGDSQWFVGLIGFLFISLVVYEILWEALGLEPSFSLSDWLGKVLKTTKTFGRKLAVIMSVSWDAALCGPGVIAEAQLNHWSTIDIIIAFVVFGLVAALGAAALLTIGARLHNSNV